MCKKIITNDFSIIKKGYMNDWQEEKNNPLKKYKLNVQRTIGGLSISFDLFWYTNIFKKSA